MNKYLIKIYSKEYFFKTILLILMTILVLIASINYLQDIDVSVLDNYSKVDFIFKSYWTFYIPISFYFFIFISNNINDINNFYKYRYKSYLEWIEIRILSNLKITILYTSIVFVMSFIILVIKMEFSIDFAFMIKYLFTFILMTLVFLSYSIVILLVEVLSNNKVYIFISKFIIMFLILVSTWSDEFKMIKDISLYNFSTVNLAMNRFGNLSLSIVLLFIIIFTLKKIIIYSANIKKI